MENIYREQVSKMQKLESTYVVFSQGTKQPLVICDKKSFNDQIWVFEKQEQAKEFAEKRSKENQDVLMVGEMANKQLLPFYSSLYLLGVNEVVFVDEKDTARIPLNNLVIEPSYSNLPEEKKPLLNPQMQLTGIYFMQELHRKKPNNEKPRLHELEEEMAANLVRSKFLIAVEIKGDKKEGEESNIMIPCVKNQEGKMFQPIFTDPNEFNKFNREKKFQASVVEFCNVEKVLGKDVEGIVVNPQSINIVILKSKIPSLLKQFPVK